MALGRFTFVLITRRRWIPCCWTRSWVAGELGSIKSPNEITEILTNAALLAITSLYPVLCYFDYDIKSY